MRTLALLALAGLAVIVPSRVGTTPAVAGPEPLPGFTTTVSLPVEHAGESRAYVLHVPDGLLGPAPLVVALHGALQSADRMRDYSRLEDLADRHGFVVAFGMGVGGSWNAGGCCRPRANDVAYLDALLDHAAAQSSFRVDPARVFLTGFSNGGMMALRYACDRAERLAAVAVVSATVLGDCAPTARLDVLAVHGETDTVVPLEGGHNAKYDVDLGALRPALQPFRDLGGHVRVRVVPGVGHGWMTDDEMSYDASVAVWDWLRDHPRV